MNLKEKVDSLLESIIEGNLSQKDSQKLSSHQIKDAIDVRNFFNKTVSSIAPSEKGSIEIFRFLALFFFAYPSLMDEENRKKVNQFFIKEFQAQKTKRNINKTSPF